MARKQKSVAIDGWTYEITQLGAVEGRELAVTFIKVLGRFAPMIASATKASKDETGLTKAAALELVEELVGEIAPALQTLDPKELDPLWDAFARSTQVRGKDGKTREPLQDVFDDHFAGEYYAMVQFFIEAAKLNFGDFLSRALAKAGEQSVGGATP